MYNVLPVCLLDNSFANLILCASPPDRVVADWPIEIYPSPTSFNVLSFENTWGFALKKSQASSTVISRISLICLLLYLTERVSLL